MIRPAFSYPLEIAPMASSSDCQNLRTSGGFAREEGWLVIGVSYSCGYNQAVSSAKSFWRRLGKIVVIMELPVQPSSQPSRGRHFERAPWCYLLWGGPVVLVIGAGIAYGESVLSLTARGVLWVAAVAWAGTGCLINGRSCGRVHCRIDGILFPLLAIVGALNVLSVI